MAGHSKWKNIRIRKGKQDALRGRLFTKLSREIIVAARSGGGDPAMNARLRVAVEKAKESGVPAENIKRAIDRGTGVIPGAAYEELIYEGRGPGGTGIILRCYTENKNRTVGDVRTAFNRNNGAMADNGEISWQFKHCGNIVIASAGVNEDELTLAALEAGAEDVQRDEESFVVTTSMPDLHQVNTALEAAGYKTTEANLTYFATNKVELSGEDQVKLLNLLDALEDLDDVQYTYVNVDISEEYFDQ